MVIIFYDWTIEDFPNLLHCKFIWFPLWHKWYLERGNGWNNYKGLTWKVTHNKTWDKIFKFLGFTKGHHPAPPATLWGSNLSSTDGMLLPHSLLHHWRHEILCGSPAYHLSLPKTASVKKRCNQEVI
jgi:hypothetical protein